ncbi:hypothetical protein [Aquipuribacter hungaricus]|uniref:Uncharacterized protein n=1 Tax=Aquipuribacter hungaricus TaxID=545624 RepID=A0ABV7WG12_9MICO
MSSTHVPDARIDAALRSLDAAPGVPLDDLARARGDAALERALAQGRTPGAASDSDLPRPRRTGLRVATIGLAAAVAAIGIATSQTLGGAGTAYAASWTPAPSAASDADVAAAQQVCDDSAAEVAPEGSDPLRTRLAERRGDLVLLAMDDGSAAPAVLTCIVALPPGGDAEPVGSAGGGGMARPAPDAVSDASVFERTVPGDELSVIDGLAGERVQAVTVHSADGHVVEATVAAGHYAAWWPGPAMRRSSETSGAGVDEGCEGDYDGARLEPGYTLDVTLDDGTVLRGISAADL